MTLDETEEIDNWLASTHPALVGVEPPGPPWCALGRGARLLPHVAGTDGMYVLGRRMPGR
jgi:hypothetical protein